MTKRRSDFILPTLDDLFTTKEQRDDALLERMCLISQGELHPFKDHPLKIQINEEMERMPYSITKTPKASEKQNGWRWDCPKRETSAKQKLSLRSCGQSLKSRKRRAS